MTQAAENMVERLLIFLCVSKCLSLDLGIWVLSHIDLRSTARVRVAREFLIESIEGQREVVLGEKSKYFEAA
jgi:hypothetical protein